MKLATREDIEAPIAEVFAAVCDFDAIESRLRQRGVSVEHDPAAPDAGPGRRWLAEVSWRGRRHRIVAELIEVDEGQGFAIESRSGGVVCLSVVDLVALSRTRTRMLVSLDLQSTTLSSRLLIQSLRLARGRLSARLKARVAEFARRIETGSA